MHQLISVPLYKYRGLGLNQQPLQGLFSHHSHSFHKKKKKIKPASFASPLIRTTATLISNPSQPQTQTPRLPVDFLLDSSEIISI